MDKNICRFVPYRKDTQAIQTVNFVWEKEIVGEMPLRTDALYKMHLCISGEGIIGIRGRKSRLRAGDMFFTFAGTPYTMEAGERFTYMYISFLGAKGSRILDMLGVSSTNCVFSGCEELESFWIQNIQAKPEVMDLVSESVLLYSFAFLGNRIIAEREDKDGGMDAVQRMKKYIDDHFSQSDFSLETMSRVLGYHKKYISHVFKKHMQIGVVEYLNTLRIQNACAMIDGGGATCVSDIAFACGFSDAQYFSKVFKNKLGISPAGYIKEERKKKI